MDQEQTRPRQNYLSQLSMLAHRQLDSLVYRLRPDHPAQGLEYIPIASAAHKPFFPTGVPLEIDVWNTFKGRRERYYDFLAEQTADAELMLLQEFCHDPGLALSHQQIFAGRD